MSAFHHHQQGPSAQDLHNFSCPSHERCILKACCMLSDFTQIFLPAASEISVLGSILTAETCELNKFCSYWKIR
ncbi:hypothetical protein OPV22_007545 [Ensete ventricosum]|uniref:Uncharacterized protein n=1 Tax=Ensete ventricosum TaxID=4639 RepID=A0AAV8RUB1_ENSVE|nr:hypothetical protein OPV22_007545 [Ensete ventricosum]